PTGAPETLALGMAVPDAGCNSRASSVHGMDAPDDLRAGACDGGCGTSAAPALAACYSSGTSSNATMLMILISGLMAGPAVSLYGSPTVSPVTAALCVSEPLPP